MNDTNTLASKFFELGTDMYRTFLKSVIWGQEQSLGLSKELLQRSQAFQKEGLLLVGEYSTQLQRGQDLLQENWNSVVKYSTDTFKQYSETTQENFKAVTEQFDKIQTQVAETVSAATKTGK